MVLIPVLAFSSRSPRREFPASFSVFPGFLLPGPGPSAPGGPSGSYLTPMPSLSPQPRPPSEPPGQPAPNALTCEPSPGPSISAVAAATRQSGGSRPLASLSGAASTLTSCSWPRLHRGYRSSPEPSIGIERANPCLLLRWGRDFRAPREASWE